MNGVALIAQPGEFQGRLAIPSHRSREEAFGFWVVLLCAAHIPIALLAYMVGALATVHALATLGVGLFLAAYGRRRLIQVAYWSAYVAGVEVLWRMANTPIFWEYGKYGTASVLLLALVRSNLLKGQSLPLAYFALLVPSSILTIMNSTVARGYISGNLSGPFALMACALFFSRISLTMENTRKIFLAVLVPTLGIATITMYSTAATVNLRFSENSNLATSGGFGPNQVSATLGLGALAAWMLISTAKSRLWLKTFLFGVMMLLAIQSALTFSRGGLYNAVVGAFLGSTFLMKDAASRQRVVLVIATIIVIASFIIVPYLENFTGGTLGSRFSSTNTSGRTDIFLADLEIWKDNPLLGVGPGMAKGSRALYVESAGTGGAHTEFSRLLSEHGAFGFAALILLICAGVSNVMRARTAKSKACNAAMIGWSFLYMTNAAMRLVAPSFALGLTFATFLPENPSRPRRIAQRKSDAHPGRQLAEG